MTPQANSPETAVSAPPEAKAPEYQKKDFVSNQTVRWCPGCGDYAILDSVQKTFAGLGIAREKFMNFPTEIRRATMTKSTPR